MDSEGVEGSSRNALSYALRIARKKAKKSQEEASQMIGHCRTTVCAIEAGQRKVSAQELEILANFYGATVDDLLEVKNNILNNVAFLTLAPAQTALIQRLIGMKPSKSVIRSLQFTGVSQEDLEEIASALIQHLLDPDIVESAPPMRYGSSIKER